MAQGITSAKLTYLAMQGILSNGGQMSLADIYAYIENHAELNSYDKGNLESGGVRWKSLLNFFSVEMVKAGYLVKKNGVWHITDEGTQAVTTLNEHEFFKAYHSAYTKWQKGNANRHDKAAQAETSVAPNLDELQSQAIGGIKGYIAQKNPYEFQDLVAALLRGMGYYTPFVAPKGKDGGIDIIAYQDPLGASMPHLKVQVKHYPKSSISVDEVRKLAGTLSKAGEVGLLVTSGTFTGDARKEPRTATHNLRLIDIDELIQLWVKYYGSMAEEDKLLLPITPIYFIKPTIE